MGGLTDGVDLFLLGKWLLWQNKENVPKGYLSHFTHNNSRSWVTGAIFFFFYTRETEAKERGPIGQKLTAQNKP